MKNLRTSCSSLVAFLASWRSILLCSATASGALLGIGPSALAQEPRHVPSPPVSDPMLSPPPPPPRQIASWDEALAIIRAQSPDYVSSYESVARAEAQKRIALAAVLPVLTGQASYSHQFVTETVPLGGASVTVPPANVLGVGATLSWSAVNPRSIYALGTADGNIDVARLSFEDRRRTIAFAVVDAMLSTLAAARVAELDRVGLRAGLERLALAEGRLRYGQGTALDLDRAAQDIEASRSSILAGDEALRQAREALGLSLASPVAVAAPGDLDLEQLEQAVARTCRPNEDIDRRPDVAAARARVEVARRMVHDAELMLAPSLGLVSQAGYASQVTFGPLTSWTVQGAVTVPFYDGGLRYGAARDARAALEQARQALVSTRLGAIVGSAQAARAVGVLQSSREVARRQRDLAERIDGRTRDGYAHGLGTSLDLVTSAQALRQAEIGVALLDFQIGRARASAALSNAECMY